MSCIIVILHMTHCFDGDFDCRTATRRVMLCLSERPADGLPPHWARQESTQCAGQASPWTSSSQHDEPKLLYARTELEAIYHSRTVSGPVTASQNSILETVPFYILGSNHCPFGWTVMTASAWMISVLLIAAFHCHQLLGQLIGNRTLCHSAPCLKGGLGFFFFYKMQQMKPFQAYIVFQAGSPV